jgi:hypothetical protein
MDQRAAVRQKIWQRVERAVDNWTWYRASSSWLWQHVYYHGPLNRSGNPVVNQVLAEICQQAEADTNESSKKSGI